MARTPRTTNQEDNNEQEEEKFPNHWQHDDHDGSEDKEILEELIDKRMRVDPIKLKQGIAGYAKGSHPQLSKEEM